MLCNVWLGSLDYDTMCYHKHRTPGSVTVRQQVCSLQLFCQHTNDWLHLTFVCGYTAPPAGLIDNNRSFLKIVAFSSVLFTELLVSLAVDSANSLHRWSVVFDSYPSPKARMCDSSSEGMKTLRNSAEKMPPFFMAPVFLMLSVTERRGWRKWNSLHKPNQTPFKL